MRKILLFSIVMLMIGFNSFGQASAPVLSQPSDNSTVQDVNVTLIWNPSLGGSVSGYEAQISTDSNFTSPINLSTLGTQAFNVELLFNQTYYWRVRGINAPSGNPTAYSAFNTFTTFSNQFNFASNATIATRSTGSFTIAQDSSMNSDTVIVGNFKIIEGVDFDADTLAAATADSLADAINVVAGSIVSASVAGAEVTLTSLTLGEVANTIVLDYIDSGNGEAITVSGETMTGAINGTAHLQGALVWDTIPGVTGYRYEMSTDPSFLSNVVTGTVTSSENSVVLSQLLFSTTYYWRIRAIHSQDESEWSVTNTFITPDNIALNAPADSAVGGYVNQKLNCVYMLGVREYLIESDTSAGFGSSEYAFQKYFSQDFGVGVPVGGTSDRLLYGQRYYWRATGNNDFSIAPTTAAWSFVTKDDVDLISPDDAAEIGPSDELKWDALGGTMEYEVEIADNAGFTNSTSYSVGISTGTDADSTFNVPNTLTFGTTYHWRVRSMHDRDTSGWSGSRTFSFSPVGINTVSESTFELFPNPATDMVILQLTDVISESNARVTIYDVQGKNVKMLNLSQGQSNFQINISDLEKGIYQMEVFDGQHSSTRQIICQ